MYVDISESHPRWQASCPGMRRSCSSKNLFTMDAGRRRFAHGGRAAKSSPERAGHQENKWRGNTTTAEAPVWAAPAVVLLLLTGYVVVQRDAVPAVVDVGDLVAPAALGNLVPQGDGRQVRQEDLLGLVRGLVAVADRRGVQAVGDGLVERRVGVAGVVGAGTGLVDRAEEVVQRRVVCLPAGTDGAGEGLGGGVVAGFLEGGVRLAFNLDAERVLELVDYCLNPGLVSALVGVVGNGERLVRVPLLDGVGLGPGFLGLVGVERQVLGSGDRVAVAVKHGGREVLGGLACAVEDHLGDLFAVDRHGDRLAAELAGLAAPFRQVFRDGDGLVAGVRLVDGAVAEVRLEVLQRAGRDGLQDVQVVGHQVLVRRVVVLVDLERYAGVLGLARAVVVRVRNELDLHVVLPAAVRELVRTIADRLLAEALRVLQRAGRDRHEGGVTEAQRPVGFRLREFNGEGLVVDDLQAGHGLDRGALGAGLVVALDALEEAAAELRVLGSRTEVPGVDERLGRDGLAVGDLLVLLDLDGEVLAVLAFDGLGQFVHGLAGGVIADQAGEHHLDDLAAANFVGVGRHQRALGLRAVGNDDLAGVATGAATGGVGPAAAATGQGHGGDRHHAQCFGSARKTHSAS